MALQQFSFRPVVLACVMVAGVLPVTIVHGQTSHMQGNSQVRVQGNKQRGAVHASGGKGGVGANALGTIDLTGTTNVNAAVLRKQEVRGSQVRVMGNRSEGNISSTGSTAAANSVLAEGGKLNNSHATNTDNIAREVRATGVSGSVAMGVMASVDKQGRSLANSQSFQQSEVQNTRSTVVGNQADNVQSDGGSALANSVLVRESTLNKATIQQSNNRARQISARGGQGSVGAGMVADSNTRSMAAANAVSVSKGRVSDDARVQLSGNRATQVDASGGTALTNSVGVYSQGSVRGGNITLEKNTARNVSTQGGSKHVMGGGRNKNGILVANGVYVEGHESTEINRAQVAVRGNTATDVQADGGRVNANALAVNGRGKVSGGAVLLGNNRASHVSSQSSEKTVLGFAVDKGVGNSHANSVQVHGQMRDTQLSMMRNRANQISSSKGVAAANSVQVGEHGKLDNAKVRIADNTSTDVQAENGKAALAASLRNEGQVNNASIIIQSNRVSHLRASRDDAATASVHNRSGGRIESNSHVRIRGNESSVSERGLANSLDNQGEVRSSQIAITGNRGRVSDRGSVNSVENSKQIQSSTVVVSDNTNSSVTNGGMANSVRNSGTLANSKVMLFGNRAQVQQGGRANSVENTGQMRNSTVLVMGNRANVTGNGMANSVKNDGHMRGSKVTVAGNKGTVTGSGKINSVENTRTGRMTGDVVIASNYGHALAGGTVNSVINHGEISGKVLIVGNNGMAAAGGVSNSVINRGNIKGKVAIVGNSTVAAAGVASGSVRVGTSGTVRGSVGVAGGVGWSTNDAVAYRPPTGVINQSIIVGGTSDRIYR